MEGSSPFPVVAMVHLVVLALWGGVVATEAVIEIAPFRHRELHAATIRLHFWIDLLVELPLVLGVVATGVTLIVLTETLSTLHLVKIAFAAGAVAITLYCILVVVRRGRRLRTDPADPRLWAASRRVLWCFALGLAAAAVAATLGFTLALPRLAGDLSQPSSPPATRWTQILEVDHIEVCRQQRIDPNVPIGDTVGAMTELVAAAKVGPLGLPKAAP